MLQRRDTSRQIDIVFSSILTAAGLGLAIGSNRIDLAIAGLVVFSLGALVLCIVEDLR